MHVRIGSLGVKTNRKQESQSKFSYFSNIISF